MQGPAGESLVWILVPNAPQVILQRPSRMCLEEQQQLLEEFLKYMIKPNSSIYFKSLFFQRRTSRQKEKTGMDLSNPAYALQNSAYFANKFLLEVVHITIPSTNFYFHTCYFPSTMEGRYALASFRGDYNLSWRLHFKVLPYLITN